MSHAHGNGFLLNFEIKLPPHIMFRAVDMAYYY